MALCTDRLVDPARRLVGRATVRTDHSEIEGAGRGSWLYDAASDLRLATDRLLHHFDLTPSEGARANTGDNEPDVEQMEGALHDFVGSLRDALGEEGPTRWSDCQARTEMRQHDGARWLEVEARVQVGAGWDELLETPMQLLFPIRTHDARAQRLSCLDSLSELRKMAERSGGFLSARLLEETRELSLLASWWEQLPTVQDPLLAPAGRLRVLVVEDNEGARTGLSLLLELEGHEVAAARGLSDGLDRIRSLRPNVLITDLALADGDGFDLARELRRIEPDAHLVLLTGWSDRATRDRAASTFDAFLPKPLDINGLLDILLGLRDDPRRAH